MIHYSLKQLSYFTAAVDSGNVSRAAEKLHVSQPSVSMAIAHLERELGAPLLIRQHSSGVSPTPLGRALYQRATALLKQAEQLMSLQCETHPIQGNVVLACMHDLSAHYLPRLLQTLRSTHPALRVDVIETDFSELGSGLREGRYDAVINYDVDLDIHCERHTLKQAPLHALLPADHPYTQQSRISLPELLKEPFILSNQAHSRAHFLNLFQIFGLTPNIAYRATSFELLRGMVANGLGVSLAYTQPAGHLSYDGKPLVTLPLLETTPTQRVVIARQAQFPQSAAGEALWQTLTSLATPS